MADDFEFYIDIEDNTGKLGPGPITSAARWTYTARTDKAGSASFEMPASDPKAQFVLRKRKARAWALIENVWTEVGVCIIDHIERKPDPAGIITLMVSGDDELREEAGRSVGSLDLSGAGAGVSHAAALAAVTAAVATGWTLTPAGAPGNNFVYGKFAGESVLAALVSIAQKTLTHFYRSGPRTLTFASAFTSSGLRAIQADGDDLAAETCAITSLVATTDTYDLLTRIVPFGSGNGEVRLTLASTDRTAPAGYTLDAANNWLQHDASVATFGIIDAPWIEFKAIRSISNTDADLLAASNALFDLALKELVRRAIVMQSETYSVTLAGCSQLLKPLRSLRLVYRDIDADMDIDADVNILSATWEVTKTGIQTTAVELSTGDTWPETDVDTIVNRITEGSLYQAHPQTGPNAYVIAFTKSLDDDTSNPAEFRFRFDQEVLQLTRVCFDFELLPLESTVKSVGGTSTSTAASGDHTHTVTIGTHTHGVTISAHTHTVTIGTHTHTVTIGTHSHTATTSNHSHTVSVPSHTHSVPDHQHYTSYEPGSGGATVQIFSGGGSPDYGSIVANGIPHTIRIQSDASSGATTAASGGSSTPTSSSGGGETVTSSSGGSSSPTSDAGGSSTPTSSSGGASTPTSDAGGSTSPTSASGGSHTHTLTAVISMEYGLFRDNPALVFSLGMLEYSVDGATWFSFTPGVNGYTSLGGGWNRVDLTALLQNPVGFRPLSSNNLLEIRRKSTAFPGRRATIDAQLSVRTTIQSIVFS